MPGELKALWSRGHYHELFGYTDDSFTALDLAAKYASATQSTDSEEDRKILSQAFATLNAPLSRQLYEGCRNSMQVIRERIGDDLFYQYEEKIWSDLWKWTSERHQPPPDQLVERIIQAYGSGRKPSTTTSPLTDYIKEREKPPPEPPPPTYRPTRPQVQETKKSGGGCGCWLISIAIFMILWIFGSISNCPTSKTTVSLDKTEISFSHLRAGTALKGEDYLTLTKKGSGEVKGKVSTDRPWLTASPASFTLKGDTQKITVQVTTKDISTAFKDTGTISISTDNGDFKTSVTIDVYRVVFEENFPANTTHWDTGTSATREVRNLPGALELTVKKKETVSRNMYKDASIMPNYAIETWASKVEGMYSGWGIVFGLKTFENVNFYLAEINEWRNQIILSKFAPKSNKGVSESTDWVELNKNKQLTNLRSTGNNKLKVVCNDKSITVLVNGVKVEDIYDNAGHAGSCGLAVINYNDTLSRYRFEYFLITSEPP